MKHRDRNRFLPRTVLCSFCATSQRPRIVTAHVLILANEFLAQRCACSHVGSRVDGVLRGATVALVENGNEENDK